MRSAFPSLNRAQARPNDLPEGDKTALIATRKAGWLSTAFSVDPYGFFLLSLYGTKVTLINDLA